MLQCITVLEISSTNHWISRQMEIIAIRPIMLFDKSPLEETDMAMIAPVISFESRIWDEWKGRFKGAGEHCRSCLQKDVDLQLLQLCSFSFN